MAILVDPVSIEPMRRTDLEAVHRIDKRCYPTPWLPTAYLTELSNRAACYLVARIGQEVVGFGGQWVIADEAHITTLAVDPDHRRRKIGERLLLALLEEAILQGASRATLEVREGNRVAQGLYRKYGFREAAIRKNYYTDNGENAIVMWADEINSSDYQQRLRELRHQLYEAYQEQRLR
ncbi:MAG TPA: ribosomal protein S18-alanine N-acetyltransferase [Chthonomonadaceae bacterium]|nr:ribosomal protein S18-alanine N-acetyltransferase [Chthonomonadaceae bacterium]